MNLSDALIIFVIIALTTFTISILVITFFAVRALKSVSNLAEDIKGKTQLKALAGIPAIFIGLVSKFIKSRR